MDLELRMGSCKSYTWASHSWNTHSSRVLCSRYRPGSVTKRSDYPRSHVTFDQHRVQSTGAYFWVTGVNSFYKCCLFPWWHRACFDPTRKGKRADNWNISNKIKSLKNHFASIKSLSTIFSDPQKTLAKITKLLCSLQKKGHFGSSSGQELPQILCSILSNRHFCVRIFKCIIPVF